MAKTPNTPRSPVETLSVSDLLASPAVRCHKCWCIIRLDDAEWHEQWHETLKQSVSVAGLGFGGIGL